MNSSKYFNIFMIILGCLKSLNDSDTIIKSDETNNENIQTTTLESTNNKVKPTRIFNKLIWNDKKISESKYCDKEISCYDKTNEFYTFIIYNKDFPDKEFYKKKYSEFKPLREILEANNSENLSEKEKSSCYGFISIGFLSEPICTYGFLDEIITIEKILPSKKNLFFKKFYYRMIFAMFYIKNINLNHFTEDMTFKAIINNFFEIFGCFREIHDRNYDLPYEQINKVFNQMETSNLEKYFDELNQATIEIGKLCVKYTIYDDEKLGFIKKEDISDLLACHFKNAIGTISDMCKNFNTATSNDIVARIKSSENIITIKDLDLDQLKEQTEKVLENDSNSSSSVSKEETEDQTSIPDNTLRQQTLQPQSSIDDRAIGQQPLIANPTVGATVKEFTITTTNSKNNSSKTILIISIIGVGIIIVIGGGYLYFKI